MPPAGHPHLPTHPAHPLLGVQNRWVIYKKGLEDEIDTVAPQKLGGLQSEQYLALNPQGKMPLLVLPDGTALPESQVRLAATPQCRSSEVAGPRGPQVKGQGAGAVDLSVDMSGPGAPARLRRLGSTLVSR